MDVTKVYSIPSVSATISHDPVLSKLLRKHPKMLKSVPELGTTKQSFPVDTQSHVSVPNTLVRGREYQLQSTVVTGIAC